MSRLLIVFALAFLVRLAVAAEGPTGAPLLGHVYDYGYEAPEPVPPPRLRVDNSKSVLIDMPSDEAETATFRKGAGLKEINEENDGSYKLTLDNGNFIMFKKGDFFRSQLNSWAALEEGFLVFSNNKDGVIEKGTYLSNVDLLKIAQELENVSSKQDIVAEIVRQDAEQCLEGLKVAGVAIVDTIESAADGAKKFIQQQPQHGFNYDDTKAQCDARRRKLDGLADRLHKMLSKKSPTLDKFAKEQWPGILTLLLGESNYNQLSFEGGVPGENTSKLGTTGRVVHSGVAGGELLAAARLFRKPLFKPAPPATTRIGGMKASAKAFVGKTLRWGTGTVLLYQAGKRSIGVYTAEDPTWSPVGSALLATEAGERAKNWITANGFVTDKQKHRLTTDEFFAGLKEDPRKPEGIPQPPAQEEVKPAPAPQPPAPAPKPQRITAPIPLP